MFEADLIYKNKSNVAKSWFFKMSLGFCRCATAGGQPGVRKATSDWRGSPSQAVVLTLPQVGECWGSSWGGEGFIRVKSDQTDKERTWLWYRYLHHHQNMILDHFNPTWGLEPCGLFTLECFFQIPVPPTVRFPLQYLGIFNVCLHVMVLRLTVFTACMPSQ